jgi:molybdenum cofactor biosynthesis enzyme MoaA
LENLTRPSSTTKMTSPYRQADGRPRIRVIPEELGFGQLSRKELKEAASELSGNQPALIMVGEPTVDKAFDKAVTRAAKTVKQNVDMTTDQLAQELKNAVGS